MFGSKESKKLLIVDLRSDSIGIALVEGEGNLKVIFSDRKIIPALDTKKSYSKIGICLDKLLSSLIDFTTEKKISTRNWSVKIFLSTPWYVGRSKTLTLHKESPIEISSSFINDALLTEEKSFEKEAIDGKFDNLRKDDIQMIERQVSNITLNGYEVSDPIGKQASFIEISFFMSLVSFPLKQKIIDVIEKHISPYELKILTFPLSVYKFIKGKYKEEPEFLFVDISGKSTEISFSKQKLFSGSDVIPYGGGTFSEKIAAELNVTPQIALSSINMLSDGSREEDKNSATKMAVEVFMDGWRQSVKKSLEMFSFNGLTVFLVAPNDVFKVFSEGINKLQESEKKYNVIDIVSDKVIPEDPYLSLEILTVK